MATHETEHGPVELWEVRPSRVSLRALPGLKAEALAVIEAAGITTEHLLQEAPHGSLLRDEVINQRQQPGDSITGLAARIFEHAAHAEEYRRLGAVDQAMNTMAELGALVAVFDVYRQASTEKAQAGAKSAKSRGALRQAVEAIDEKLKGVDSRNRVNVIVQRAAAQGVTVTPRYVRLVIAKKRN